jgi:hypothetical protein
MPDPSADGAPDIPVPMDDATAPAEGHVEPHGAPAAKRVAVRVGRDGTAKVGRRQLRFSRSLAGALVTVEVA